MKRHNDNINSLLDTLTNVVSILIIVFAVTQVIVTEATNSIKKSGYTATEINQNSLQDKEAALNKLKHQYKIALQDRIDKLQTKLKDDDTISPNVSELSPEGRITDDLSVREKKLAQLRANYSASKIAKLPAADIDGKIKDLKKDISQYEKIISGYQQDEKKPNEQLLSIGINNTPLRETNFVRLPDPRPAPESAKPIFWVCRYGRIIEVPFDRLSKLFLDEAKKTFNYSDNSYRRVAKMVNHFNNNQIGTDNFFWNIVPVMNDDRLKRLFLSLKWPKDTGETPEMIASGQSFFRHRIQSLQDSKEKFYFHFQVWDDSFDVYLLAREIASQQDISAGWSIYEKSETFMVQQLWPTNQSEMDSSQEVKLAID